MPRLSQVPRADVHPFGEVIYQMLFDDRDPVAEPGTATGTPPDSFPAGRVELPVSAVFSPEADQRSFVWVIDESRTVRRREVQVGELQATGLQVMEGLEPGEWVATAGVHYLKEGQKVRLLDEEG